MTPTEARSLLLGFVAAWPRQQWSTETLALYTTELSHWELDRGDASVRWLIRNSKWCPTIAELVDVLESQPSTTKALPRGACVLCEDGWALLNDTGRTTVARCPNGCVPNALVRDHGPVRSTMGAVERERNQGQVAELVGTLHRYTSWAPAERRVVVRQRQNSGRKYRVNQETGDWEPV